LCGVVKFNITLSRHLTELFYITQEVIKVIICICIYNREHNKLSIIRIHDIMNSLTVSLTEACRFYILVINDKLANLNFPFTSESIYEALGYDSSC
jgi:hypothetical protein